MGHIIDEKNVVIFSTPVTKQEVAKLIKEKIFGCDDYRFPVNLNKITLDDHKNIGIWSTKAGCNLRYERDEKSFFIQFG